MPVVTVQLCHEVFSICSFNYLQRGVEANTNWSLFYTAAEWEMHWTDKKTVRSVVEMKPVFTSCAT